MIQVGDIGKSNEIKSGGKVKKASTGSSFSAYLEQTMAAEENTAVQTTSSLSGTEVLLAAQMVDADDEKERRRQVVERGKSLIEKLEEIRDALLIGAISKDRMIEIARYVRERRGTSGDERLDEIMAEIELRIEVELAKLMK